jgi:hypothetical protein
MIALGVSALVLIAALAGPWAGQAPAPETTTPETAEPAGSSEPPAEAAAPAPGNATQPTTEGCDSCTLRHERIRKLKEAREAEAAKQTD